MKENAVTHSPSAYEIIVRGSLASDWSHWFEGWNVASEGDGTTVLTGRVVDQSELHGLLAKIHNLNLPLISVNPVPPSDSRLTPTSTYKVCPTSCGTGDDREHMRPPTDETKGESHVESDFNQAPRI